MSQFKKGSQSINQAEHTKPDQTGENVEAKRVVLYGWDYTNLEWVRVAVDSAGVVQTSGSGAAADGNFDLMDGTDLELMDGTSAELMSG